MTNEQKHVRTFVMEGDHCELTIKHYADGGVMIKQGDDQLVYVPPELVAFVAHSLMLANQGAKRVTN